MTLLVLAMLFSTAFDDYTSCTVQALVYQQQVGETINVQRMDLCTGVRMTADDKQVVLYSPHVWVAVPIAPEHGWRRFQYRWTSDLAHVETKTIPITWGWVERG